MICAPLPHLLVGLLSDQPRPHGPYCKLPSSFLPMPFMARAFRAWAVNRRGKNSVRNLRHGPRARLVRGINTFFFRQTDRTYKVLTKCKADILLISTLAASVRDLIFHFRDLCAPPPSFSWPLV